MDNDIKETELKLFKDMTADKLEDVSTSFADEYDFWKNKMNNINKLLDSLNIKEEFYEPYSYNDFCKAVLKSIKEIIDKEVDYVNLFLSKSEFAEIMSNFTIPEDDEKFRIAITNELKRKYKVYFIEVIDVRLTYFLVKNKINVDLSNMDMNLFKTKENEKTDVK